MTRFKTATAAACLALALTAAPADAVIGASPEASAAVAKRLGAARVTFNLAKGLVVSEEWQLRDPGLEREQAEAVLRTLTGTQGDFAKRDPKGGNLWLTGKGGHVGLLFDAPKTPFLTAYRAGTETQVHTGPAMVWTTGLGLRPRGVTPANVAVMKAGMLVEDATFLLGNWDSPNEVQHVTPKALTWNAKGKPSLRLHLDADGLKVKRVQKL